MIRVLARRGEWAAKLAFPAIVLASPAVAQELSPARVLGSIVVTLAAVRECGIPVRAEMKEALAVEGLRLQIKLHVPDREMEQLQAETAEAARGGDCATTRQRFDGEAARVLEEARRALARQ